MGKQINLYLQKTDFEKIQNYLLERNFVFIKDEISTDARPIFTDSLFQAPKWGSMLTFADARLHFRQWQTQDQNYFRISNLDTEGISFEYFGEKEDIYRVRFYYDSSQNLLLEKAVNRFFRWLRTHFEKISENPAFYKSPALVLESYF